MGEGSTTDLGKERGEKLVTEVVVWHSMEKRIERALDAGRAVGILSFQNRGPLPKLGLENGSGSGPFCMRPKPELNRVLIWVRELSESAVCFRG